MVRLLKSAHFRLALQELHLGCQLAVEGFAQLPGAPSARFSRPDPVFSCRQLRWI
jgi:hypothetical protein